MIKWSNHATGRSLRWLLNKGSTTGVRGVKIKVNPYRKGIYKTFGGKTMSKKISDTELAAYTEWKLKKIKNNPGERSIPTNERDIQRFRREVGQ